MQNSNYNMTRGSLLNVTVLTPTGYSTYTAIQMLLHLVWQRLLGELTARDADLFNYNRIKNMTVFPV